MTIDEFVQLFPKKPFALRYVARGGPQARKFGWRAQFTSDCYTTDSDSFVDGRTPPDIEAAWSETLEGALEALAMNVEKNLESSMRSWTQEARDAEMALAEFRKRKAAGGA